MESLEGQAVIVYFSNVGAMRMSQIRRYSKVYASEEDAIKAVGEISGITRLGANRFYAPSQTDTTEIGTIVSLVGIDDAD